MPAGAPKKPPALVKVPVSLKLPRWLLAWMDAQPESRAVLIEEALKRRHKLKPPDVGAQRLGVGPARLFAQVPHDRRVLRHSAATDKENDMEGSSYRFFDMGTAEGRAEAESYERSKAEKVRSGQQLYAKIKRSSKYYGQGEKGALFEVFVEAGYPEAYLVQGGPGGQYRLADVNLFIVDEGREVRIS